MEGTEADVLGRELSEFDIREFVVIKTIYIRLRITFFRIHTVGVPHQLWRDGLIEACRLGLALETLMKRKTTVGEANAGLQLNQNPFTYWLPLN